MCHSVNWSLNITVQNAGCVFAIFVADTKIIFAYNFGGPSIIAPIFSTFL